MRNGDRFPKTAFQLDWAHGVLTCPQEVQMPFAPGGTVHFPAAVCAACPVQARRTASPRGRSVHIHPDERLLAEFRQRQLTAAGRAQLRERAAVEHSLDHSGHWLQVARTLPRTAQHLSTPGDKARIGRTSDARYRLLGHSGPSARLEKSSGLAARASLRESVFVPEMHRLPCQR